MKSGCVRVPVSLLLTICISFGTVPAAAQKIHRGASVTYDLIHDVSLPLSVMAGWAPARTLRLIERDEPKRSTWLMGGPTGEDTVEQHVYLPSVATVQLLAFDGITQKQSHSTPPDTNGSVGATQFVEITNTDYEVFDKSTGSVLLKPTSYLTIWRGFAGGCGTNDNGDPIVLWDKLAQRWLVSHLSFTNFTQQYLVCIAVSTSADATGSYARYAFSFGSSNPDYEKLAVWPDAYYFSANPGTMQNLSAAQPCAFDRSAMLSGGKAAMICFKPDSRNSSFLPSDLDGATLPPSGAPNHYLELGNTTNLLNEFDFHVDFANPKSSTFSGPHGISVPAYSLACGGANCIPQPSPGAILDSLGDRLMFRLAYRNFGDHEAMVAVHSVAPGSGSSAAAATRWYELRATPPGGAFTLFQSGTFQDESTSLWMGSIAMDKLGDIAMGMNASSMTVKPSVWYTGRVPTDPIGQMELPTIAVTGTAVQQGGVRGSIRWGDYSSMSVDPADDCTFWYSQEYYNQQNGGLVSVDWSTHVVAFKFSGCN